MSALNFAGGLSLHLHWKDAKGNPLSPCSLQPIEVWPSGDLETALQRMGEQQGITEFPQSSPTQPHAPTPGSNREFLPSSGAKKWENLCTPN